MYASVDLMLPLCVAISLQVETEITKPMIFEIFARFWCVCIALLEGGKREVTSGFGEFRLAGK